MNKPSVVSRKAAIYLRISRDREMDGLAIDHQRERCEELARFRRWDVVETYVDQSKSATDRTKKRSGRPVVFGRFLLLYAESLTERNGT